MYPSVAIIISTYNWVEALELSLNSVAKQTILPNEVIVADDGSTATTKSLIDKLQLTYPIKISHVWQEDLGFRLAQIRNKAIAIAQSDYIIQIDGDIILNQNFVADHLFLASKDSFIAGSRVSLSEDTTNEILKSKRISLSPFSKGVKNRLNAVRFLPLCNYYKYRYKKNSPTYGRGCNMSFWKKDLIAVNGYNEDFRGWGKEDTELMVRLLKLGVRKQFIKFGGIAYHLFHRENSRDSETKNILLLDEIEKSTNYFIQKGLDQYL